MFFHIMVMTCPNLLALFHKAPRNYRRLSIVSCVCPAVRKQLEPGIWKYQNQKMQVAQDKSNWASAQTSADVGRPRSWRRLQGRC